MRAVLLTPSGRQIRCAALSLREREGGGWSARAEVGPVLAAGRCDPEALVGAAFAAGVVPGAAVRISLVGALGGRVRSWPCRIERVRPARGGSMGGGTGVALRLIDPVSSVALEPVYGAFHPECAGVLAVRLVRAVGGEALRSIVAGAGGPPIPRLVSLGVPLAACLDAIGERAGALLRLGETARGSLVLDALQPRAVGGTRRLIGARCVERVRVLAARTVVRARTADPGAAPGDPVRIEGVGDARIEAVRHLVRGWCYRGLVEAGCRTGEPARQCSEAGSVRIAGARVDAGPGAIRGALALPDREGRYAVRHGFGLARTEWEEEPVWIAPLRSGAGAGHGVALSFRHGDRVRLVVRGLFDAWIAGASHQDAQPRSQRLGATGAGMVSEEPAGGGWTGIVLKASAPGA